MQDVSCALAELDHLVKQSERSAAGQAPQQGLQTATSKGNAA
jgi:hypothetical protein